MKRQLLEWLCCPDCQGAFELQAFKEEGLEALEGLLYTHRPHVVSGSGQTASALLPRVHRIAALLKRWLLGIHQGRVSREHLDDYLNKLTFWFNRRLSRHRGKLFYRLVQQAVAIDPIPYQSLMASTIRHVSSVEPVT